MTRAPAPRPWEPDFIRLWQAGASHVAIAAALSCPVGTVKSRAHALAAQGTIQSRPRGGAYPSRRARAREGPRAPVQRPVQPLDTGASQSVDTGAGQGLDTAAVQRLDRLEGEVSRLAHVVQALVDRLEHPPVSTSVSTSVSTPVQSTTLPLYPKGKAVRWNLWILDAIREELATVAAARGISPSQLVQEWLWKALTERRASTP